MTNAKKSVINYRSFTKRLQNSYKGVVVISILRNRIVLLILTLSFLLSIPAYAYADNTPRAELSTKAQQSTTADKFGLYTNLAGYYPDEADFEVSATQIKHNSARLIWKSENLYLSYTVKQFNVLKNEWEEIGASTSNKLELKSLKPKTEYRFAVFSTASGEILGSVSFETPNTPKKKYKLVNMGLPKVSGSCKTYAYYTAVTVKSSPAYAVLNSGSANGRSYKTHTDPETGIRMVGDYYCAALGTYYGREKGTKYKVTLSTGRSFKIILCDTKSDRHTDSNHQYAVRNKDVVEFYVEKSKIPEEVRGNYNVIDKFKGDIVKIEKIVDID